MSFRYVVPDARGSSGFENFPAPLIDWQTALWDVKVLFLEGKYKQCTARCAQLLDQTHISLHSVHEIFLCFYAAVSLELTAYSLHPLSSNKLPLLASAREYFLRAAASLPSPLTVSPISMSAPSTPTSVTSPSRSASLSVSSATSSNNEDVSNVAKPSPLRIRKVVIGFNPSPTTPQTTVNSTSASVKPRFFTAKSTRLQSHNTARLDGLLRDLNPLITSHISSICDSIAKTELDREAHQERLHLLALRKDSDGRDHDHDVNEDVAGEEKRYQERTKARIERLKANGWKRERFSAERYQDLAERALAEL